MSDILSPPRADRPVRPTSRGGIVRRALASDLVDRLFAPHGVDAFLELVDPSWVVRGGATRARVPAARSRTTEIPPAPTGPDAVSFGLTGLSVDAAGTILETAEAAGLAPKARCRRGICGTCTSTKTSGRVRNLITDEVSADGQESIRLCVSVPVGEVCIDL